MKHFGIFIIILIAVLAMLTVSGCGTEAERSIKVDNGRGVVITYDTTDGGSEAAATGKDMTFDLDADGNIAFNYSSDTESEKVETNDPAAIVDAAGNAASDVLNAGVADMVTGGD